MTVRYRETGQRSHSVTGGGGDISIKTFVGLVLVRTIIVFLSFFPFVLVFLLVSVDQQKNVGYVVCDRCPVTERARRS